MSPVSKPYVSPREYLRQERLAECRGEYHNGEIVMMPGTTRVHNRIVANLTWSLGNQLIDRPCNNYTTDLKVSVQGGRRYFIPT